MFQSMDNERRRLIKALVQLVYFMRGSIQYEELLNRTKMERDIMQEFIEQRLEVESKKMNPNY